MNLSQALSIMGGALTGPSPTPSAIAQAPKRERARRKRNPNGSVTRKGFSSRVGHGFIALDTLWAIEARGLVIDGTPSLALHLLKRGGQRAVVITNPDAHDEHALFSPVTQILAHYPGDINPHRVMNTLERFPLFG